MVDTGPLESQVITKRRAFLIGCINSAIEKGITSCNFHPTDGQFSAFDVNLMQDYCHSLELEAIFVPSTDITLKPYIPPKTKKVEEEDWVKDLEGPKPGWFKLWVNKIIYWMNK